MVKKKIVEKVEVIKNAKATQAPKVIVQVGESQLKSFLNFVRTQGVVGLAVGLVLGGAVSVLVKSLVDNVVMPPLGFVLGSAEGLKGLSWTIGKTSVGKTAVLHYGIFLNDLINFIVIAAVVYLIVKLLRFDKIDLPKK